MGQSQQSAWKRIPFDVRLVLIGLAGILPTGGVPAFGEAGPEGQEPGIAGRAEWVVEEPIGEPIPESPFRDCPVCPEMVVVPAGSFRMGCVSGQACEDDEKPVHRVTIAVPFAVGKYEVTFDEWDACVADGGCDGYRPEDRTHSRMDGKVSGGRGRRPVIRVSWDDVQTYIIWMSEKTGKTYRLLSEAEWEYVTRAGSETLWNWGNEYNRGYSRGEVGPDARANFGCNICGNPWFDETAPVGSFEANAFGLHDVHGNVWEWVQDCWNGTYAGAPADGSAWEQGDCEKRVLRGGNWLSGSDSLRSSARGSNSTGSQHYGVGFRVARSVTP